MTKTLSSFLLAIGITFTTIGALAQEVTLKVGDVAPDFSLLGSDKKTYSLSDYKGKQAVALAFFPKAFTGGWSLQVQSLRDSEKELRKYKVAYFMASVDSVEDNTRFAKEQHANFPLLCDTTKDVARLYGPLVDYNGNQIARRWTIYIDKEGIVRKIDEAVKPASAGPDMVSSFAELGFETK